MIISKHTIDKLGRKVMRELELAAGARVPYNRVHKNKKAYDRKRDKKVGWQD